MVRHSKHAVVARGLLADSILFSRCIRRLEILQVKNVGTGQSFISSIQCKRFLFLSYPSEAHRKHRYGYLWYIYCLLGHVGAFLHLDETYYNPHLPYGNLIM